MCFCGKGLALRFGYRGPCLDALAEQKLLDAPDGEWILACSNLVVSMISLVVPLVN